MAQRTVTCKDCKAVLSTNGITWVRLGFKATKRWDGSPKVQLEGRVPATGNSLCKPCAQARIQEKI